MIFSLIVFLSSIFANEFIGTINGSPTKITTSANKITIISSGGSSKSYSEESFGWPKQYVADVNGDGISDFIGIYGTYCKVISGTSDGGLQVVNGTTTVAYAFMNEIYFNWPWIGIGDVNGDRKADLIAINGSKAYIVPGVAFINSGYPQGKFDYSLRSLDDQIYFAWPSKWINDVNGDGKVDYIAIDGANCYVVWGVALGSYAKFDYNTRRFQSQEIYASPTKFMVDMNMDGKSDILIDDSRQTKVSQIVAIPGSVNGFDLNKKSHIYDRIFRMKYLNKYYTPGKITGEEWFPSRTEYQPNCPNQGNVAQVLTKYKVELSLRASPRDGSVNLYAETRTPTGTTLWSCDPVKDGLWEFPLSWYDTEEIRKCGIYKCMF